MGDCVSKAKKMDVPSWNIVANNVCIGSSNTMEVFHNSNIEDTRAEVCKQEPLKEVYATDECTDDQIVTNSKALKQETSELICTKHNLGDTQLADTKSNNEPSKTDERASSCQTMTEKHTTGSTLPKQTGTSSSHGSSTDASFCKAMTEKPTTGSTLPKQTGTSSSHGSLTDSLEQDGSLLSGLNHLLSEGSNDSTIQFDTNRCSSPTNDVDKLKDYTIVSKRSDFESSITSSQLFGSGHTGQSTTNMTNENMSPDTPRVEEQQLASSHSPNNPRVAEQQLASSHSPNNPRVAEQQLASSHSPNNPRVEEEQLASSHSPNNPRVEEEQLASSHSPNNPRVAEEQLASSHSPNNPRVEEEQLASSHSPNNPRVAEEQLASSHSPNNPRVVEQQLASSHYTPSNNELTNTSDITPGTSNVPENHGTVVEENQIQSTNQSSVNSGNNRTEDNERNSVGDGEVGGNQEVEEDQGEEHQDQENQAEEDQGEENQTGEDQQEEHQEEDLDIQVDAELSQEPAVIGEMSLGNNNNFNDQHLTEQIDPCDVNKTIQILAIDVGQYSMNKNFDIAMKGNDEVKIENGKCIGSTAHHVSCAIRDIANHSMKPQQNF